MNRKWIALVLLTLGANFACAASFDCDKAGTKVEKMICADPELSKLDEILGKEYQKALNNTSEPTTLKHRQMQWLKDREKCDTRLCVKGKYSTQLSYLFGLNERVKGIVVDSSAQVQEVQQMGPYTFKFIKDNGWSVCHKALSNMKSFSPTQEQIACGEAINLSDDQFNEPAWKELSINDNWKKVYEMDTFPEKVRGRKPVPFDVWKKNYQALVEAGKIHPRLRHVVFKLPSKELKRFGDEGRHKSHNYIDADFFGYTRNLNNIKACKREIETGLYRGLKKYTGDRISYFVSSNEGFEYLSSDSTFSNPASFYDSVSRLGNEENLIIYDSAPYLVSASPFRPNGYKYHIKFFRIFSFTGSSQETSPAYAGQYICTIEASWKKPGQRGINFVLDKVCV